MKNAQFTLVLSVLFGASACGAMRASQARSKFVKDSTTAHTYAQPCGDIWASARTMLFGQNYQVKSADAAAGLTLETDWKDESQGASSRYLFQGSAPSEATCKVVATKASRDAKGETNMSRDWQMEWDLLKQVDVAAANQIETEADAAGKSARDRG